MLIQNSHASNSAKEQPEAKRATLDYADGYGHTAHPKKRLKGIHGKKAVHGQVNRTEEDNHGSKKLREAPPAQFAHHPSSQQHLGCSRQGRKETQSVQ